MFRRKVRDPVGPVPPDEHGLVPVMARRSSAAFNPLLRLYTETQGDPHQRDEAVRTYSFAVPTDEALGVIAAVSPEGVVEVGAGTGYWAALLAAEGVDVIAYDVAPAPSSANRYFRNREPWFSMVVGDELDASGHPARTMLLVWPTHDEVWPSNALERFHEAGGTCVVFVGELPGGRTGDDRFHALIGNLDHCVSCELDVVTAACICGVESLWQVAAEVVIPSWGSGSDRLQVLERVARPKTETGVDAAPGPTGLAAPASGRRRSTSLGELGVLGQVWTIGVVGFCIARAAVVWPLLRRYGVNPWWFLAIDIGTAPLYGIGQAMGVKLIRDEARPVRDALPWIVMLLVGFVAPYAYLLVAAGQLPAYVVVGVGLWVAVFGAFALRRLVREARRRPST